MPLISSMGWKCFCKNRCSHQAARLIPSPYRFAWRPRKACFFLITVNAPLSSCPSYGAQSCVWRNPERNKRILKYDQAHTNNRTLTGQGRTELIHGPAKAKRNPSRGGRAGGLPARSSRSRSAVAPPGRQRAGERGQRQHGQPRPRRCLTGSPTGPRRGAAAAAAAAVAPPAATAPAPARSPSPPASRSRRGPAARGPPGPAEPRPDLLEWKRCSGSVRWQDESWQPKSLTSRQPSSLRLKLPPRGGCWCESSGHGSSGARNFSYGSSVMAAGGEEEGRGRRRRAPHARSGRAASAAISGRSRDAPQAGGRRGELLPAPALYGETTRRPLPRRRTEGGPRRPARLPAPQRQPGPRCYGGGGGGGGQGRGGLRARRERRGPRRRLPGAAGAGRGGGHGPGRAGRGAGDLPAAPQR